MSKIAKLLISLNRPRLDSALYGWGDNSTYGLSNVLSTGKTETPTTIDVLSNWSKLSAGSDFVVGIKQDGSLWSWGTNTWGQLGRSDGEPYLPKRVTDFTWTDVSAGDHFVLAIRSDGKLFTWGRNSSYGLGTGGSTTSHVSSPTQIGTASWVQVSAGKSHSMALRPDGSLYGWGDGQQGQTGTGSGYVTSPTLVQGYSFTSVSAGHYHTAAVKADGTLWAWGRNVEGQIGALSTTPSSINQPYQVGFLTDWSKAAAGGYHTVATRISDSSLWAWGRNTEGQLGDSTTQSRSSPIQISTSAWSELYASEYTTAAIRQSDESLHMWGTNINTIAYSSPITSWTQLSVGDNITAGIKSDGTLWAWGLNQYSQIGDSSTTNRSSPVQIGTGSWLHVSVGKKHVAAIRNDYTLWGWGDGTFGQLGAIGPLSSSSPAQIGSGSWLNVSAGGEHTIAINDVGAVYAWGRNDSGQLGDSTTIHRSLPVQISATGSWTAVSAGEDFSLAILDNGTLWGWGNGYDGQIGELPAAAASAWKSLSGARVGDHGIIHGIKEDGTLWTWGRTSAPELSYMFGLGSGANTVYNTPQQVGSANTWKQVVAGDRHVLAVTTSGTLYGWGNNTFGQTGRGTNTAITNTPTQLDVGGSWLQVAAGEAFSLAIKDDHSIWGWGSTTNGRLLGVEQLPASWSAISSGRAHTLAITSDGRLFAWGNNNVGQIGLSDQNTTSSIPYLVKAGSWIKIATAGDSSYAIKSDKTLWAWGGNANGQLGVDDTSDRVAPTQIPGSWTSITAASKWAGGVKTDGTAWVWGTSVSASVYTSSPVQVGAANGSSVTWTSVASTEDEMYLISNTGKVAGIGGYPTGSGYTLHRWFDTRKWKSIHTPYYTTNKVGIIAGIDENNNLYTWGYNEYGALGHGTRQNPSQVGTNNDTWVSVPTQIGSNTWSFVTSKNYSVVAKRTDNTLWQWGATIEPSGAPFEPTTGYRSSPIQISSNVNFNSIVLTDSTYYGIANTGAVYRWGWWSAWDYQPSPGVNTRTPYPTLASSFPGSWNQISASSNGVYMLGIKSDNTLWVSGIDTANGVYGRRGILAHGAMTELSEVQSKSWTQIAYDDDHALAIATDGTLWGWGKNDAGQLGLNHTEPRYLIPEKISTESWISVAVAGPTSFAIKGDGTLWGWGANRKTTSDYIDYNILGNGNTVVVSYSSPVQVGSNTSWKKITAAANTTTNKARVTGIIRPGGIDANSQAFAWGWYTGNSTNYDTFANTPMFVQDYVWDVSTNYGHTVLTTTTTRSPSVFAYGYENGSYKTGRSTTGAVALTGMSSVGWNTYGGGRYAAAGAEHSVVVAGLGQSLAWGKNDYGQLGIGSTYSYTQPQLVSSLTNCTSVAAGIEWTAWTHTSNNTVSLAGRKPTANTFDIYRSNPTQLGSGYVLPSSTTSNIRIFGTRANTTSSYGPMYTFEYGFGGSNPSAFTIDTPNIYGTNTIVRFGHAIVGQWRQIPGSWTHVHAGEHSAWAVASNGTLWGWGRNNENSPLGTGSVSANTSSPIQIGAANNWSKVEAYAGGSNYNTQIYSSNTSTVIIARTTSNSAYHWGAINGTSATYYSPQLMSNNIVSTAGYWTGYLGYGGVLAVSSSNTLNYLGGNYLRDFVVGGDTGPTTLTEIDNWPKATTGIGYYTGAVPVLEGNTSWVQVSGGRYHAVAISSNGTMWSWGRNDVGQLGTANVTVGTASQKPRQVGSNTSWSFVSAGSNMTLALMAGSNSSNYSLYGWGYERQGILGTNTGLSYLSSPVQIGTGAYTTAWAYRNVTDNAVDSMVSYAIKDNQIYATGNGYFGDNITNTSFQTSNVFTFVAPVSLAIINTPTALLDSSWSMVSAGSKHAAAIKSDGNLYTWGGNDYGQLGDGTTQSRSSPIQIGAAADWTEVSAGYYTTAGIKNSSLYAWGLNADNQLGDGTTSSRSSPVNIGSTLSWSILSAGNKNIAAQTTGGNVYLTGSVNGNTFTTPTLYQANVNADSIYAVYNTNLTGLTTNTAAVYSIGSAISDTTLRAKGYAHLPVGMASDRNLREFISLDGGYPTSTSSPVQIGSASWSSVSAGFHHALGISSTGSLWAWGLNWNGQIGNASSNNKSAPTQIGLATNWTSVEAGSANSSLARASNQTLWSWGYNSTMNLLGDNSSTSKSSPVQIGSSVSWSNTIGGISITGGSAINANNLMYYWGSNESGQAGRNNTTGPVGVPVYVPGLNTTSTSSPVQIGANTRWRTVSSRTSFMVGVQKLE